MCDGDTKTGKPSARAIDRGSRERSGWCGGGASVCASVGVGVGVYLKVCGGVGVWVSG
jgi:hypothetical protein